MFLREIFALHVVKKFKNLKGQCTYIPVLELLKRRTYSIVTLYVSWDRKRLVNLTNPWSFMLNIIEDKTLRM